MVRFPGWLVFLIFVPLQVWIFLNLLDAWGFWGTLLFVLALGFLGNRAARAPWLRELLFPWSAQRWEERRHVYQGILFVLAALTWLLPRYAGTLPETVAEWSQGWPQPWLPLAFLVTLLKSGVR